MNINDLKQLLGNDNDLNELLDEAIERGFLNESCESTAKNNELYSAIESYCMQMIEPQHVMFKVEGINLENVDLEIFDLIRDSVHNIIEMGWHEQKSAGYKIPKLEYQNNVSLSLRSASFQVDVELPAVAKLDTKRQLDSLVDSIINTTNYSINTMDKYSRAFLEPVRTILSHPKVTGIKISTDKSIFPADAPEIVKSKKDQISNILSNYDLLHENVVEEIPEFDENVLVFASDSKKRIFSGYAREMTVFNFDCTEPENGDAWWNVINNQIASVDDLSNTVSVRVQGRMENRKKVKVNFVTLA